MLEQRPTEPESPSEWQRVAGPRPERRFDDETAFRGRLTSALRAGHGQGVGFELRVDVTPLPRVLLGCRDPVTARWVTRVLLPAYGRNRWARRARTSPEGVENPDWGRRVHEWPDPLREPSDGLSAVDALVLGTGGLAPGTSVRCRFSPCPATWTRLRETPESERPRPARDASATFDRARYGRHPSPGGTPTQLPLFWRATVVLCHPLGTENRSGCRSRARSIVEGSFRSARGNGLRFSGRRFPFGRDGPWFPLAEDEVACLLPGLEGGPMLHAGEDGPAASILPIGRSTLGRIIGPSVEATQGRHLAVLGETGMGKSSTLVSVARTAARLGGVVLFDPLGETARAFLQGLSTEERARLTWISPRGRAVGINALEGIGRKEADPVLSDRRLNDLVHALRRVRSGRYESSYWGPRLEEMLTRALSAAAAFSGGTLSDAHTLLATGGRTRQVVPPEAQEAVRELSDRVRERPDDAEGARRLLYEVVRSPVLHRMLCERNPSLHAADLVEPGRIAVISGDASLVGESAARYLLAVYLALVWSQLLARPSNPKTFVVLDESQWFSHESLAEMLQLARRRNVHVVLATQTIGSLPEAVAAAVWTNVSDFVAFRGSPEEARELARATSGLSVEEILALPRGHAVVLLGKGNSVAWIRTVGRPPGPEAGSLDADRSVSEDDCSTDGPSAPPDLPRRSSEEVLDWIRMLAEHPAPDGTVRVDLGELRRHVDPDGRAVRDVGAILGRAGALVSSVRTEGRTTWIIDPARVPPRPAEAHASLASGRAEGPQPS